METATAGAHDYPAKPRAHGLKLFTFFVLTKQASIYVAGYNKAVSGRGSRQSGASFRQRAAGRAKSMKKSSAKKPEQRNKKRGQQKNLFERNPKKTLIFTVLFLIIILDGSAGAFLNSPTDSSFRCSNPYYHHDFLPDRNAGTAWGPRRYRIITNSLGFRDGTVRDIPLSSGQKRILLIGDSYIEGMGVSYEDSAAGILAESLKAASVEVLNAASVSYSPKLYFL